MPGHCSKCGAHQEAPWKFCPLCGEASVRAAQQHIEPEKPEKSPAPGAFGGLFYGLIAMPMLIIVGAMLCLTGLGAFVGVPMIIAGVLAPLMGPLIGMGAMKGKCPWCGAAVNSVANTQDFDCAECGKRIAIKHREFVPAA